MFATCSGAIRERLRWEPLSRRAVALTADVSYYADACWLSGGRSRVPFPDWSEQYHLGLRTIVRYIGTFSLSSCIGGKI